MSDSEEFKINKAYAEKYDKWRQKEELQRLKDKYGDVSDLDSDSSTSESEDENAEALTASLERDWLRTYAAVKTKDPKIYEKDTKFYDSEDETGSSEEAVKVKKEKPVYLKDFHRQVLLEKGGKLSDESDSDEEPQKPSYFEEQEEIKESFKKALEDSENDSSDSEFLTKKVKTEKEKEQEEEDYLTWIQKQKKGKKKEKQVGIELDSLKQYWNNPELDEGEKFLRDFIVKQKYLEKDTDRIPSYEEIVNDGDGLSDDEENVEKQEEFERKYNFRYEEPDQEFIKSFPRNIEDTVRRKENKRAEKRKEKRDRKNMEKERKTEEIKQLKNLMKQEIMQKIEKLKETTGNKSLALNMEDLEGDFDPKKYDEMMSACFNEDYYGEDEEMTKPVFEDEDDDLLPENWDGWTGPDGAEADQTQDLYVGDEDEQVPHVDDPDFIMDADYDPTKVVKKSGKKKKKSKFKQVIEKKKPVFDPNKKTFEEYFNEYYSLDYEDLIDDKPCRFKYRTVVPNDFGLSADEVLTCKDKELNAWASLKKMTMYRTQEEEMADLRTFSQKAQNMEKKIKFLPSLLQKSQDDEDKATRTGKKKRKKKKKLDEKEGSEIKSESVISPNITESKGKSSNAEQNKIVQNLSNKAKRKIKSHEGSETTVKKQKFNENTDELNLTGDTRDNYEKDEESKKKKKVKKSITMKTQTVIDDVTNSCTKQGNSDLKQNTGKVSDDSGLDVQSSKNKKKKKKKKQKLPKLSDERLLAYGINPKKLRYLKTDNFKKNPKLKE